MGRESGVRKDRLCKACNRFIGHIDAKGLLDHTLLCKRAVAANLVLPESILPQLMAQEPIFIQS